MEYVRDGYTNCNWCTWNNSQELDKGGGLEELEIRFNWFGLVWFDGILF